jgi:hypothetical protein
MATNDQTHGDRTSEPDDRIETRAELLPEEVKVGTEDANAQAEEILQESDERVTQAETDVRTGTEPIERRESSETA